MSENLIIQSNGLSNSKLQLATATPEDVLIGKTFYAGDKTLKTGTSKSHVILGVSLWNNNQVRVDSEYFLYAGGRFTAQKSFNVCIYPLFFMDYYAIGTVGIQLNGTTILSVYSPDDKYIIDTTPKVISVKSGDTISGGVWAQNDWASFSFILEKTY